MQTTSFLPTWLLWFLAGTGLAFLEMAMPGFIVLFFGIGCWVVALTLLIWELSLNQQVLLFIIASIASMVLLRRFLMTFFRGKATDLADEGLDDFPRGTRVKVAKTITPSEGGRIFYRGTLWDAAADEEIQEGESAEIVSYADHSRMSFFVKRI